jgi:hypothetical protein
MSFFPLTLRLRCAGHSALFVSLGFLQSIAKVISGFVP